MKKTTKIIISLAVALLITSIVLVVSLVQSNLLEKEETTRAPYSLQSTTAPSTTAVTDSWVDLDQLASDLATATETETETETASQPVTAAPVETTNPFFNYTVPQVAEPMTTIVYVYTEIVTSEKETDKEKETETETETTEENTENIEIEMVEYKYSVNPGTRTVTVDKYLGDSSVVWVPDTISGYTVTAIGDKCFQKLSLKGVCIPETVTTIGNNAFQDCKNLKSVTFMGVPPTVTVGNNAFQNCTSLTSINLPEAESIGDFAFDGCTALETMTLKEGTISLGEYCFSNCTALKSLQIPQSVNYIGTGAFSNHADGLVIKCVEGSTAEETALKYDVSVSYE